MWEESAWLNKRDLVDVKKRKQVAGKKNPHVSIFMLRVVRCAHSAARAAESSFDALGLSPRVATRLGELRLQSPTAVQSLALPHLIKRENAIVTAPTGSGKSLGELFIHRRQLISLSLPAYLLPVIHAIAETSPTLPHALVLVPTIELVRQTTDVFNRVASCIGASAAPIYRTQLLHLQPHSALIVSTLGALLNYDVNRTLTHIQVVAGTAHYPGL